MYSKRICLRVDRGSIYRCLPIMYYSFGEGCWNRHKIASLLLATTACTRQNDCTQVYDYMSSTMSTLSERAHGAKYIHVDETADRIYTFKQVNIGSSICHRFPESD